MISIFSRFRWFSCFNDRRACWPWFCRRRCRAQPACACCRAQDPDNQRECRWAWKEPPVCHDSTSHYNVCPVLCFVTQYRRVPYVLYLTCMVWGKKRSLEHIYTSSQYSSTVAAHLPSIHHNWINNWSRPLIFFRASSLISGCWLQALPRYLVNSSHHLITTSKAPLFLLWACVFPDKSLSRSKWRVTICRHLSQILKISVRFWNSDAPSSTTIFNRFCDARSFDVSIARKGDFCTEKGSQSRERIGVWSTEESR